MKLPPVPLRTAIARAIYETHTRSAEDWRRDHLGASLLGKECNRFLWYSFRWAQQPDLGDEDMPRGQLLRLFNRGHREEAEVLRELEAAGFRVISRDPKTGRQYRATWCGSHAAGGIDGAIQGIPSAPKTWHLLEIKTFNDKRFRALKKDGIRATNIQHFAQMQLYMHGLNLKRALYIAVNKDDDEIYEERVEYEQRYAEAMVARAELVISSSEPLSRIKNDPTWFECKLCSVYQTCQMGRVDLLERNCRTCLSSTPMPDGSWRCDLLQKNLDAAEQRAGCDRHLFVPALLPWKTESADEAARSITYTTKDGARVVDHGRQLATIRP